MTISRVLLALAALLPLMARPAATAQGPAPEVVADDRVGLADLSAYATALAGRATADDSRSSDPPTRVGFRDLWDRPEAYRGRRVTVVGRVERTFRQPAVGSFPPLAESWLFSTAGDPICIVFPRPESENARGSIASTSEDRPKGTPASSTGIPATGRAVAFTGTFLKTIRYAAGDGDRLAPLIVGDRPPRLQSDAKAGGAPDAKVGGAAAILRALGGVDDHAHAPQTTGRLTRAVSGNWVLTSALAAIAFVVIAVQHFRGTRLRRRRFLPNGKDADDLPLHFVDGPTPV